MKKYVIMLAIFLSANFCFATEYDLYTANQTLYSSSTLSGISSAYMLNGKLLLPNMYKRDMITQSAALCYNDTYYNFAQSFIPNLTYATTSGVFLPIVKVGSGQNLTIAYKTDSGSDTPSSTVLASTTLSTGSYVTAGSYQNWPYVALPYTFTNTNKTWLTITCNATSTTNYGTIYGVPNTFYGFPNGTGKYSTTTPYVWTAMTGAGDIGFAIAGNYADYISATIANPVGNVNIETYDMASTTEILNSGVNGLVYGIAAILLLTSFYWFHKLLHK